MLNTIQTILYKAVNTREPQVVPVLSNVFLIIRAENTIMYFTLSNLNWVVYDYRSVVLPGLLEE